MRRDSWPVGWMHLDVAPAIVVGGTSHDATYVESRQMLLH